MKIVGVVLAIAVLGLGCTVRHADFTLLSTKTVEISRVDLKRIQLIRNQEGQDGRLWFLFIPLGTSPKLESAVDQCLESGGGDFMTSAVISRKWWTLLLLTYGAWHVKGDVGNSISYPAGDLPDRRLP